MATTPVVDSSKIQSGEAPPFGNATAVNYVTDGSYKDESSLKGIVQGVDMVASSGSTASNGGARTTTRSNVNDPMVMSMFTDQVLGAVGPGGTIDQATNTIINGGNLRRDAQALLVGAIQQKAKAEAEATELAAIIQGTQALRRQEILNRMNLNPDIADNIMLRTGDVINKTDDAMSALKPEIDERMAVGMFDNPFQWLVNQTILPGLVARYNNEVTTQNAAIDTFKTVQGVAKSVQDVATNMDADLIMRQGVAAAAAKAEEANEKLAQVQAAASDATIRDSMALQQLQQAKVSGTGALLQATRETQTVSEGNSAKAEKEAAEKETLNNINRIRRAAGGAPFASMKELAALRPDQRQLLVNNAGSGRFGKTFSESIPFVRSVGSFENLAQSGSSTIRTWVMGTLGKVGTIVKMESEAADKIKAKYDAHKETLEKLDKLQDSYAVQADTDMRTADEFNPLKLAYTTIAQSSDLANNPLAIWINTYGPKGKDPRFNVVDEQYIMQRFAHGVSTGKMPMADAVKAITEFYKVATIKQKEATAWPLFGLEKPEKTYPVRLQNSPGGTFMNQPNVSIDLGNQAEVENYLTKQAARQIVDQRLSQNPLYVPGIGTAAMNYKVE